MVNLGAVPKKQCETYLWMSSEDDRPTLLRSKKRKRRHLFDNDDHPSDEDYDPNKQEIKRRKTSKQSKKGGIPLPATSVALTAMKQAKKTVKPRHSIKEAPPVNSCQQAYEPWARRTRAGKKQIPAAAGSASALMDSHNEQAKSTEDTDKSNEDAAAKSTEKSDKSSETLIDAQTDKSNEDAAAKSTEKSDKSSETLIDAQTDKSNEDAAAKSTEKSDKSSETLIDAQTDKSNEDAAAKSTENSDKSSETATSTDNNTENGNAPQPGVLQVQVHALKKTVAKERVHKCGHCPQVFKNVKDLNSHNQTDHPDHPFQCSKCGKTYSSTNALARHEKRHEGFGFKCGQCNFVCQFRYELRDHLKKHTDTQKWPCERGGCGLQFSTKRGMRQHMQVHSDNKFPCTYCPKVFETPGYLRQHTYYHTGGFPCYCGHKAKNPTARNIHQKQCDSCKEKKNVKVLLDDFKESSTLAELNESSSSSGESPSSWHRGRLNIPASTDYVYVAVFLCLNSRQVHLNVL